MRWLLGDCSDHCASKVLLPDPGGASSRVSLPPFSTRALSEGRAISADVLRGGLNLARCVPKLLTQWAYSRSVRIKWPHGAGCSGLSRGIYEPADSSVNAPWRQIMGTILRRKGLKFTALHSYRFAGAGPVE